MKTCWRAAGILLIVLLATAPFAAAAGDAAAQRAAAYVTALGGEMVRVNSASTIGVAMAVARDFSVSVDGEGVVVIRAQRTAPFNKGTSALTSREAALTRGSLVVEEWAKRLGLDPIPAGASQDASGGSGGWQYRASATKGGVETLPRYDVAIDSAGRITRFAYHPAGSGSANVVPELTGEEARGIVMKESGYPADYDTCKITLGYGRVGAGTHREPALFWEVWTEKAGTIYVVGYVDAITGRVLGLTTPAHFPSLDPNNLPTKPQAGDGEVTPDQPAAQPLSFALLALAGVLLVFLVVKLRKR